MPENHTDSEAEEEENGQHHAAELSEDENFEGEDKDSEETDRKSFNEVDYDEDGGEEEEEEDYDDDEDQDYEEVVVKPRHLNEVTSLTDKTSPWTSISSDPDLVSLDSLGSPEEPELNQEEEMRRESTSQTVNSIIDHSPSRKCKYTRLEEREHHHTDHSDVSADTSDTESDGDRTQQSGDEGQAKEPNGTEEGPDDITSSPAPQPTTDVHDASRSSRSQDTHSKPYP